MSPRTESRRVPTCVAVAASFLLCPGAAPLSAQVECVRLGTTPEANATTLRGVVFQGDRFVAVGDDGMVVLSTDAIHWPRQATPTAAALRAVAHGEGQFVAVGDRGTVLRSPDGTAWTASDAGTSNALVGVAFGAGRYVALDAGSNLQLPSILVSTNARDWAPVGPVPPAGNGPLLGVHFDAGTFVACGWHGRIATSPDGLSWADHTVATPSTFHGGAHGNGAHVVAGFGEFGMEQVARSTDGATWNMKRQPFQYSALCFGNGRFVGVAFDTACWSADGISWNGASLSGNAGNTFYGVASGMGQFVAVGSGGAIYTSSDPAKWTRRNAEVCPIVAYASGNGVSVGISGNGGMVYSSADGIHYVRRREPSGFLTSIAFGNGVFAVAGNEGILVSKDGVGWAAVAHPDIGGVPVLAFADGAWVAANTGIMASADAVDWDLRVASAGFLTGVARGNGRWIAYGWDGALWSSADGRSWQDCTSPSKRDWDGVTAVDGVFSLHASVGFLVPATAAVSRDGLHWNDALTNGALLRMGRDAATREPALVLAGEWGRAYRLEASDDLRTWSTVGVLTNANGVSTFPLPTAAGGALLLRAVPSTGP